MNVWIGIGRLGKDPESRTTTGGTNVASFSIACKNRRRRGDDRDPAPTWIDCVSFGKTAEVVSKYATKGREVAVRGRINVRSWDDRDGNKRYKTEVVVDELTLIGPKPEGRGGTQGRGRSQEPNENYGRDYPADWDEPAAGSDVDASEW